jgi:hypothetical protein
VAKAFDFGFLNFPINFKGFRHAKMRFKVTSFPASGCVQLTIQSGIQAQKSPAKCRAFPSNSEI